MLQLPRVSKEYKMSVKKVIPKQKIQVLSDIETKILKRVRFWDKIKTTRQIVN